MEQDIIQLELVFKSMQSLNNKGLVNNNGFFFFADPKNKITVKIRTTAF